MTKAACEYVRDIDFSLSVRSYNVYTPSNKPCRVIPALHDAIYPIPQPAASFATGAQAFLPLMISNAVGSTMDKGTIRVLASTGAVIGVLDAGGSNARGLAATTMHTVSLAPQTPHKVCTYVQKKVQ